MSESKLGKLTSALEGIGYVITNYSERSALCDFPGHTWDTLIHIVIQRSEECNIIQLVNTLKNINYAIREFILRPEEIAYEADDESACFSCGNVSLKISPIVDIAYL